MAVARVLLLGLMGSGKTTVGHALAGRLGWPYVDNDDLVEEFAGATKAGLLQAQGVAGLRAAEAQALRLAIRRPGPFVAGVAAGVVLDHGHVAALEDPPDDVALVWLRAGIGTLAERIRRDPADRPWLTGDLGESLREMASVREQSFAELAQIVVDVDGITPQQAAAEIMRRLGLGQRPQPPASTEDEARGDRRSIGG
jgi:shikimate kinase